jgi:hydroxypyruvate isomerase
MENVQENMHQQGKKISRRGLMASAAAAVAISAGAPRVGAASSGRKFKLKYAPTLGTFKQHAGSDPIDNLKFMADQGFSAMFDNGFMRKPKDLVDQIVKEMDRLEMTLGPFVLQGIGGKTFVTKDKDIRAKLIKMTEDGVEFAKRANAKWALLVPGAYDNGLEWDYQTANVIDNLRYCAEVCEPSGLVLVIEPLNAWTNHPGLFLTKIPQAYMICRAVNSPSVKIVNDIYHQQITEGNLIPNIDMAWSEIGSFHVGDNPGRKEPTTGEINYKNVFKHIHKKGYQGVLCMEHGRSKSGKEGEMAVIEAYRACDDF